MPGRRSFYRCVARYLSLIHIFNIFGSVKNAFIITDYSGYDPEVNSFAFDGLRPGVDMSSFPHARSFIFGLNVSF